MNPSDITTIPFTHMPLNTEVVAIGGNYVLTHEKRMTVKGKEILYYRGAAVFDTTCCGAGGCAYVYVPGFIVAWKKEKKSDGSEISLIAPVRDPEEREAIRRAITETEQLFQVNFL
jgi:hypothetical protein